jgi:molybdate transport system ATP-binding protein
MTGALSLTGPVVLEIQPGEVIAVLGPNGAGKTTLLRTIAGLNQLTTGSLYWDTECWDEPDRGRFVDARRRQVGLVFQDYQLFERMTVLANISYGLRARGVGRRDARARATELASDFGLSVLAPRLPSTLSGGQRQRVALARAFAISPRVLLLDEPFAALDVLGRTDIHSLLRDRLTGYSGPAILVTHDPLDAIVLADRMVVLEGGAIVQQGTAAELAHSPSTSYVAALFGINHYRGVASLGAVQLDGGGRLWHADASVSGPVSISLAPSAITVHRNEPHDVSARNRWRGRVVAIEQRGSRVRLEIAGTPDAYVDVTPQAVKELGLTVASPVWLSAKATEVIVRREA